ncbi:tRNA 1-methyladenosine methyltransferase subunit [Saccharomycopsis crataegensis]|uniref:tRNA (adenine(58)-N(1))-methyltransferase catalytic subunit TRM61 n=1 Tax=Saccharomycopsis crataegensis TaxID=43959 RepID=A0AAV5QMP1_9ASCO|nr:tRNA 1-methyladenosine methyltransferase subunit [Saccharomycopsis crataegensis]
MSFKNYKDFIEEGDLVFAWISRGMIKPIHVDSTQCLNTRYGTFNHSSMVGQRYGSQIASKTGYGFIYLLHPTPELWTVSLPHRTQIVYSPDSSYITQKLNILPGSRVIEAGTGSGSFTHSLSRTISDTGKLFTYEFHEVRYQKALEEFQDHGLKNLQLTHRDVCKNGFEIEGEVINANAIFLDLPAPWSAIPNLDKVINKGMKTTICCFSPCIEQVEKTIHELHKQNWTSIETVEINHRKWESHKNMVRKLDDVIARLKDIQQRKREGVEKLRKARDERLNKRPAEEEMENDDGEKKVKTQNNYKKDVNVEKSQSFNPFGKGLRIKQGDPNFEWKNVSKDESEIKSHTSFLTFAFKLPEF